MFSFGNKKPNPPPKTKANAGQVAGSKPKNLSQFGFLDMGFGTENVLGGGDIDDDGDLEAELSALTQGSQKQQNKKGKKTLVTERELNAMISSSMADLPSDEDISDIDDAEVEVELGELCGEDGEESSEESTVPESSLDDEAKMKLLQERIVMYQLAETNAVKSGDTVKSKRFNRGVKSLNDLLKKVQGGKQISMEDVPPPLAESYKTIQRPVPKETIPALILDESTPIVQEGDIVPTISVKPLIPVRIAPPPPNIGAYIPSQAAPPVPPRTAPPIPPRVAGPKTDIKEQESKVELIQPTTSSANIENAVARRQELKSAALQAKRAGDQATALHFVRLVKVCDQMIEAAKQGSSVDWSHLPPMDPRLIANQSSSQTLEISLQPEIKTDPPAVIQNDIMSPVVDLAKESIPPVQVPAVPLPSSTLEALEQRLAKYQSTMQQAQEEGNSSKARRLGRIVKQYQDAIKLNKLGKPIPFDELPDPPGYPPIPGAPCKPSEIEAQPSVSGAQSGEIAPPELNDTTPQTTMPLQPPTSAPISKISPKIPPKKTALATRQDKQLAVLLERQNMFKQAALDAKKSGEIVLAKEYLRMAKGIDPLISANKCGIPVDMETLPIPPQMKLRSVSSKDGSLKSENTATDDFVMISSDECGLVPTLEQNSSGILAQLEADLLVQFKMCSDNRDHYKLMGDIANANRFDQLALHTRKDLDVVRSSAMRGDTVPRWKNEMRTFSIVKCCTDLKDDDMEVTILRGLSYNVANPKTIDTYVRFEVPIPNSENPVREKTNTIKDTNSPEYNETFHIPISRQSRTLLRIFKAKVIKFEVWAKGGFLRSDILIGTASVKLADLLNHCQIHEAADLMDGRKPVGGKLEIKLRLRDPIVGKEMEQVQEKWTVLTS